MAFSMFSRFDETRSAYGSPCLPATVRRAAGAALSCLAALLLFTACDADSIADPGAGEQSMFAVTPAAATLPVGQTVVLQALRTDGAAQSVPVTWSSSDPAVATVDANGTVNALASGTATITAQSNSSGSATATVTVPAADAAPPPPEPGAPPPSSAGAPPVARGIWLSKAELDALPMSGTAWTGTGEVKSTADAAWTVQGVEVYDGQEYAQSVMAGALVFARMYPDPAAAAYRTKVVQAIRNVMALPDELASNITGVNRFIGTWAIIADLINLPAHDPALDSQFRAWLNHKLDMKLESSGKTVRAQIDHSNNHGSWATFSLAAVSSYLGDRATLDLLARRYRRWLGNTSVSYAVKWTSTNEQATWQMNPSNAATWVGINPKGATKNGHNFDGIQPSDQVRGSPATYDPANFPNSALSHRYPETSLMGVMGALLILHRAGYTDLMGASDQAVLRAAKGIKYAADNYAAKGYVYFTGPLEATRPLINFFYPAAGLPTARTRSQLAGSNYGYTWTYWTHSGRSVNWPTE